MKGVLQIVLEQARKVVMPGNVNSFTKIGCKTKKNTGKHWRCDGTGFLRYVGAQKHGLYLSLLPHFCFIDLKLININNN